MKAVVLRRPGELVVSEIDAPRVTPESVLVRVTRTGICGTDLKIFTGAMPAACPLVMGHEITGDIVEGNGAGSVRAGERVLVDPVVYCGTCFHCRAGRTNLCPAGSVIGREMNGGFAELVAVPYTHIHRLPAAVDSQTAPLIQVLTTCLHAQRRAQVSTGQSVAVIGLGVSGQLHVQLARARGARPVVGVARSGWKRALADQLGADLTAASGQTAIDAVIDATAGRGADVVIEATGHLAALGDAIAMVRSGGTVVLFGIYTETKGALPFYQLYFKEPTIASARAATADDFPEAIDLVAQGQIRLAPLVTQVFPFVRLREALAMLEDDVDGRMKIILEH